MSMHRPLSPESLARQQRTIERKAATLNLKAKEQELLDNISALVANARLRTHTPSSTTQQTGEYTAPNHAFEMPPAPAATAGPTQTLQRQEEPQSVEQPPHEQQHLHPAKSSSTHHHKEADVMESRTAQAGRAAPSQDVAADESAQMMPPIKKRRSSSHLRTPSPDRAQTSRVVPSKRGAESESESDQMMPPIKKQGRSTHLRDSSPDHAQTRRAVPSKAPAENETLILTSSREEKSNIDEEPIPHDLIQQEDDDSDGHERDGHDSNGHESDGDESLIQQENDDSDGHESDGDEGVNITITGSYVDEGAGVSVTRDELPDAIVQRMMSFIEKTNHETPEWRYKYFPHACARLRLSGIKAFKWSKEWTDAACQRCTNTRELCLR